MAVFVGDPSRATAFPNLHSPVIAGGRNCKPKRYCSRNDDSAQHSNGKYASYFSVSHNFVIARIEARTSNALPRFSDILFPVADDKEVERCRNMKRSGSELYPEGQIATSISTISSGCSSTKGSRNVIAAGAMSFSPSRVSENELLYNRSVLRLKNIKSARFERYY